MKCIIGLWVCILGWGWSTAQKSIIQEEQMCFAVFNQTRIKSVQTKYKQ
ncbi:MAG: hypothetical protein SH818_04425 [Saprospiraceae bacterium]|nr:hypothetical protein [Saprospiraceae bacterium]